ncbi:MAG: DUF4291 domain-containing protein [Pseudomonadota bacterium]
MSGKSVTPGSSVPERQIRAAFDAQSITVYQAYGNAIADTALAAQSFVAPFKLSRMTWIKPSFLWMMYRSGWAEKPGQERVLAITITKEGFHWALANACLSHFDPSIHADRETWLAQKADSPVRIQWDPERSLALDRLDHRSLQVGLSGDAVTRYVEDWIVSIEDRTDLAEELHRLIQNGQQGLASERLPRERTYPLPPELAARIGAS